MNITEPDRKYLYSDVLNELGRILVSVNNATIDISIGIRHIANAYKVVYKLSRKARSDPSEQVIQPLTYLVHF